MDAEGFPPTFAFPPTFPQYSSPGVIGEGRNDRCLATLTHICEDECGCARAVCQVCLDLDRTLHPPVQSQEYEEDRHIVTVVSALKRSAVPIAFLQKRGPPRSGVLYYHLNNDASHNKHFVTVRSKPQGSHDQLSDRYYSSMDNPVESPLFSRAWAFQERLLFPRILHFHSEELVWECKGYMYCECGDMSVAQLVQSYEKNLKLQCQSLLTTVANSDRLPALSDLASQISARIQPPPLKDSTEINVDRFYLASLWRENLEASLLWTIAAEYGLRHSVRLRPPCPPTWPWASLALGNIHERVRYPDYNRIIIDANFKILDSYYDANNKFWWFRAALSFGEDREFFDSDSSPKENVSAGVESGATLFCLLVATKDGFRHRFGTKDSLTRWQMNGNIREKLENTPTKWEICLVLRKISSSPGTYERVGVLHIEQRRNWFQSPEMGTFEII
ncbi:hypothetical protein G7Y89_g15757 [Cudoniella acicularis]|uniref:Heterokaryon incompatibility domain-containing protein n=1 Tax=Cudoniella acicularis TaxID=354080 RepID=A0A8H4VI83_9HELO|nr:hypothetical protein G7Y89_g15757 [Cudoniella acicularis]